MLHAEFHHVVEPQRSSPNGLLPVTSLVTWLIEAASAHAEERGFGYSKLRESDTTWVLARMAIEMNEYPKAYEEVTLETWVEDFNRFFSTRNFRIGSPPKPAQEGAAYGYIKTQWSMINLTTRKACDLSEMSDIESFKVDRPCPIASPGKIASAEGECVEQYRVRYSDIDVNRHMNTVKYIEHALNLFSLSFFDEHHLKRIEVQFMAEVRFDDLLSFYKEEKEPLAYLIEIRNQHNDPVNRLKFVFEEL